MISISDIAIRLILSCLLGGVIGYERQANRKSAGLRTHILVSLGSCLIMTLSINIYQSVQGLTNADPTRLAAQVVSGIGFLGAGTIMKEGLSVKGLTTAASLWLVAAIGLAVGSGYYSSAIITTLLGFLTLTALSVFERTYCRHGDIVPVTVVSIDKPGQIGKVCSYMGARSMSVRDIRIEESSDNRMIISIIVHSSYKIDTIELTENLMKIDGVMKVKCE